ncbi:MAG: CDP-alcohol phosphatidyltransferase family protein [Patescibacteria group bacterium]
MEEIQDIKNRPPKLFPHDYIFKYLVLPFFPRFVEPNHITVFRFLATPFVFWLLYVQNYKWGIPIFLLVALTDAIDGSMARVRNKVTEWGTIYDPVADKILICSVLILLIFRHLNIYLAGALVIFEVAHLIGGFIIKMRGGKIQALFWGKAKMVSQVAGVMLLLVFLETQNPFFDYASIVVFSVAIFFSALSIVRHGFKDF